MRDADEVCQAVIRRLKVNKDQKKFAEKRTNIIANYENKMRELDKFVDAAEKSAVVLDRLSNQTNDKLHLYFRT